MKMQRTRNAVRNIFFGTILKIYQIIVPFIMRTLMIYQMGLEYAGLNNLFVSVLQVLNLAELGVGAALTVSMYEPIAKDDEKQICALLNLYRKCFNVIGGIILGIGLICLPFLKYLVKGSVPDNLNIYILYSLYLLNTVLSYWLFSYRKSLIYAHQRNDINSKITMITTTVQYILQMFALVVIHNYYFYVISSIIAQVLLNLISSGVVYKTYPYRPVGMVNRETLDAIVKKVRGLITNKIGGVILRSTDSIVISAFLGLTILAVYQNYYFILAAVICILSIIFEACVAGIGNSLITENINKNYEDFCTMTFLIGWLVGICCAFFLCLYQPFMVLWMGADNLLSFPLVISLVIYFFICEMDQLIGTFKDAAGIWYQDRYRPLVTAVVNLMLSLMAVNFVGLYGVLYSSIISLLAVGLPWLLYNIFHTLFIGMPIKRYIILLLRIIVATVIVGGICVFICSKIWISGILGLIIKSICTGIISITLETVLLCKCKEFGSARDLIVKMMHRH